MPPAQDVQTRNVRARRSARTNRGISVLHFGAGAGAVAAWLDGRCVLPLHALDVTSLDYELPEELIAQRPADERDDARLLVVDVGDVRARGASGLEAPDGWSTARTSETEAGPARDATVLHHGRAPQLDARVHGSARMAHRSVRELPELVRPALWVVNDTRVLAARLFARRASGGRAEIFLLERVAGDGARERWRALGRANKPLRAGDALEAEGATLRVTIVSPPRPEDGAIEVELASDGPIASAIERAGHVPLPPYIRRSDEPSDRERYQTMFAARPGAVAAPTAGLHFTERLVAELERRGHRFARITLHVGAGTFRPVRTERLEDHPMHAERYDVSEAAALAIEHARAEGMPVVAVGTTVVRTLESVAVGDGRVRAGAGTTDLFIRPGFTFRVVDALLTNFHQPRSTLLALVMALAGEDVIRRAYTEAVEARYRFFSYGDAMLIRGAAARP